MTDHYRIGRLEKLARVIQSKTQKQLVREMGELDAVSFTVHYTPKTTLRRDMKQLGIKKVDGRYQAWDLPRTTLPRKWWKA